VVVCVGNADGALFRGLIVHVSDCCVLVVEVVVVVEFGFVAVC
jgi:hypothetical protein